MIIFNDINSRFLNIIEKSSQQSLKSYVNSQSKIKKWMKLLMGWMFATAALEVCDASICDSPVEAVCNNCSIVNVPYKLLLNSR